MWPKKWLSNLVFKLLQKAPTDYIWRVLRNMIDILLQKQKTKITLYAPQKNNYIYIIGLYVAAQNTRSVKNQLIF
jgi:hypothetical protein